MPSFYATKVQQHVVHGPRQSLLLSLGGVALTAACATCRDVESRATRP